ncbi:MAG TPA: zinc ribbon domain-containing protein [Candidatus Angelobacter sp.]|jgi:hypothetical protein|nr:zinc ribbon domain-containing protein [Candidatus Angelobacter sp.]
MNTCFRCGATIASDTAFCPECGAPQIRVAIKTDAPDSSVSPQPQHSSEPPLVAFSPDKLQWPLFWRAAWLLILLTGIATAVFMPVALLLVLPLSVAAALRIYSRRHLAALRPGQGATMGAGFGGTSFLIGILPHILYFSTHTAEFRDLLSKGMHDALARTPDPQAQKALESILSSNQSILALTIMVLIFMLLIYVVVGSVAGATTIAVSRQKPRL